MVDTPQEPIRLLDRLAPVLVFACLLVLALRKLSAADLWTTLRCGEWILANGVPHTDPFSFATPGQPWIEMRWLSMVLAHWTFGLGGVNALILAKVVLLLGCFAIVWRLGAEHRWAACTGIMTAVLIMQNRFLVRSELFSYLFLAGNVLCLERFRRGASGRWLVALPILQVLWVNLHTLFALGPVVQWIFVVSETGARWLPGRARAEGAVLAVSRLRLAALAALASSLACLANPYFLEGALLPFALFGEIRSQHYFSQIVSELASPFSLAGVNHYFMAYVLVAAVAMLSFLLDWRRCPVGRLAIWGATLYLSCLAVRNLGLFGLVSGLAIATNLDEFAGAAPPGGTLVRVVAGTARGYVLVACAALIPFFASDAFYLYTNHPARFGLGLAPGRFPVAAMEFVREHDLPRPVLCKLSEGGYVMFREGERSVIFDGRLEVYGEENVDRAVRLTTLGENWRELTQRWGISTALIHHPGSPGMVGFLQGLPDWVPVYFDESHVVFVRMDERTPDRLRSLAIDWRRPVRREVAIPASLRPRDWLAGLWPRLPDSGGPRALGDLLLRLGGLDGARSSFEEALAIDPGDATSALYLGLIYKGLGREAEARRLLDSVPLEAFGAPGIIELSGWIFQQCGRPELALEAYQRALEHGTGDPQLLRNLARAAANEGDFAAAREALERLVEAAPDDAFAWSMLGQVAQRTGDPHAARAAYERSLELRPNQAVLLRELGRLQLEQGDVVAARGSLERALALTPDDPAVRYLLDLVKAGSER